MAGQCGGTSNTASQLLAAWNAEHKSKDKPKPFTDKELELDQLFDTLAEWNDYLEKDVPYFQAPEKKEPQP